MPLLHRGFSDLCRTLPDSSLGPVIEVQGSMVPILQGRPHSHISKTILVQIRKSTHGKAKPSILEDFWLKCSLECQQGWLVVVRRRPKVLIRVLTCRPALKCVCLPSPLYPLKTSSRASQQVSPGPPDTHKHVLSPCSGAPGTWGQPQVRHQLFHPRRCPMGRVRCQSTSQSGEWWAVVIPGEREGKIMDKWEAPADLVLTSLTTRIHHTFLRPLSCPFTIFPQPGIPPPAAWSPWGPKGLTPPPTLDALPAPPGGSGRPSQPHLS